MCGKRFDPFEGTASLSWRHCYSRNRCCLRFDPSEGTARNGLVHHGMCYGSSCLRFDPSEGTASARALVRCALQRHGCLRFDPSEGTARSRTPCKHERLVKLPEVRPVRGYCNLITQRPDLLSREAA